jgi:hypothetical protein
MTVVTEWKDKKIFIYHDVKSITYRQFDGLPSLKKRDTTIDLSDDYKIIAIVN